MASPAPAGRPPSRAKKMALQSHQLHEDAARRQLGCQERGPPVGFQKALHFGAIHSGTHRGSATGLACLLQARVDAQEERTAVRRERTAALHVSTAARMPEKSGDTPPPYGAAADAEDHYRPRNTSAFERVIDTAQHRPSPPLKRHGSSVNSVASVSMHAEEVEIWAIPGTTPQPLLTRASTERSSGQRSHSSSVSSSVASVGRGAEDVEIWATPAPQYGTVNAQRQTSR